jgi:thiol-disulfide isomerase/thioredoxin
MFERLMLVLALVFFGLSIFAFVKGLHVLGVSRLAPARTRPTLLYFESDSCGPCVVQARYLEQVQVDFAQRVKIEKIDAVAEQEKAARYGIFRVPATLIIDRQGRVRHINYGLADARKLAQQLHSVEDGPEPTA